MQQSKKMYVLDSQTAFMPHPFAVGLWLRVHPCVLFVGCAYCKVKAGTPCKRLDGTLGVETHWDRRGAAQKMIARAVKLPHAVIATTRFKRGK